MKNKKLLFLMLFIASFAFTRTVLAGGCSAYSGNGSACLSAGCKWDTSAGGTCSDPTAAYCFSNGKFLNSTSGRCNSCTGGKKIRGQCSGDAGSCCVVVTTIKTTTKKVTTTTADKGTINCGIRGNVTVGSSVSCTASKGTISSATSSTPSICSASKSSSTATITCSRAGNCAVSITSSTGASKTANVTCVANGTITCGIRGNVTVGNSVSCETSVGSLQTPVITGPCTGSIGSGKAYIKCNSNGTCSAYLTNGLGLSTSVNVTCVGGVTAKTTTTKKVDCGRYDYHKTDCVNAGCHYEDAHGSCSAKKIAGGIGCYVCNSKCVYHNEGDDVTECTSTSPVGSDRCKKSGFTCTEVTQKTTTVAPGCAGLNNYTCTRVDPWNEICEWKNGKCQPKVDCGRYDYHKTDCINAGCYFEEAHGACTSTKPGTTTKKTTTVGRGKTTTTTTTKPPVTPVPPTPVDPTETINAYRYALDGAGYQGNNIACGDKLYVTTCDKTYCNVTTINGSDATTTTKVYKDKIREKDTTSSCTKVSRYIKKNDYYYTDSELKTGAKEIECGTEVKFTKSPGDACTSTACQVTYNNKSVYVKRSILVTSKPTCSKTETCESSKAETKVTGTKEVKICFVYKSGKLTEQDITLTKAITCADEYSKSYKLTADECKDVTTENAVCSKTYKVTCSLTSRPGMAASGGVAGSNGKGTIKFSATDNSKEGLKGYFISDGKVPTIKSEWTPFADSKYQGSVTKSAGTYWFWTITNSNRKSYAVLSRVHDSEPNTTIKILTLKNMDTGEVYKLTPLNTNDTLALAEKNSKYVLLTNTLLAESGASEFDAYTTGYEVTVQSNKIAVYATLTSNDAAYVPGYEPRTVSLDYGRNVILIKIINQQGRERTYTIIANRIDDRDNNNLLSNISLSRGTINFDPYVSDYTVEVPKTTKDVTVNCGLQSNKSSFIEGYEPRKVTLSSDRTSIVIKTISEAGITRSYVITFVKTDTIEDKTINNSIYLSSLSIPGTQLEFDRETNSYSVSVDYEIEELPVYAFAESANATVTIRGNQNFRIGPNVIEIEVRNGSKTKIYTVYVNRKESGLDVGTDTSLATLTIKDYDIDFRPDVLDYVVKIKREKTLVITATPYNDRSEVYMVGNNDLTGFSTVRIKVIAENGETQIYSIDIQKDAVDKKLELILSVGAGVIILGAAIILIGVRNAKKKKEYMENGEA